MQAIVTSIDKRKLTAKAGQTACSYLLLVLQNWFPFPMKCQEHRDRKERHLEREIGMGLSYGPDNHYHMSSGRTFHSEPSPPAQWRLCIYFWKSKLGTKVHSSCSTMATCRRPQLPRVSPNDREITVARIVTSIAIPKQYWSLTPLSHPILSNIFSGRKTYS